MTAREREELIDFAIGKLTELKIKTHHEDLKRRKTRYVRKTQAYQDLINLLKDIQRW